MPGPNETAIVVGGGIGGLTTALSLHQIGIEAEVFESVERIRALGLGINLLPHAVRELDALGLLPALEAESIAPQSLAYFTKHGAAIWDEPRGCAADYAWPQLSIHRGVLQKILLDAALERLGPERIHTNHHFTGVEENDRHVVASFARRSQETNEKVKAEGAFLIAADGIHSVLRGQRYPNEGNPNWNGAILWRGVAEAPPILDGQTMIWAGHPDQKFVAYPIAELPDGRHLINFIAELRVQGQELTEREDWNQPGLLVDFIDRFESWSFPWLDIPALIRSSEGTYRFPMVDRDPVDRWSFGRTTLLGDAAHPMYPIGSNGASQAILDARVLTGCLKGHPEDRVHALARYEAERIPATRAIVLANRELGPELPMKLVEERAPAGFTRIEDVITPKEILEITDRYRQTAGFALAALDEGISLADRTY